MSDELQGCQDVSSPQDVCLCGSEDSRPNSDVVTASADAWDKLTGEQRQQAIDTTDLPENMR